MKHRKLLLLLVLTVFSLTACGKVSVNGEWRQRYYEKGLEVISLMTGFTENDAFLRITANNEEIQEILRGVSQGDYHEKPDAVYMITIPTADLLSQAQEEGLNIPSALQDYLEKRMFGSLPGMLNAQAGPNILAAASICTANKLFVCSDAGEDTLYLYVYRNATPVLVWFQTGEDGAVLATGNFVLSQDFACGSEKEVKESISSTLGPLNIEVEKLTN